MTIKAVIFDMDGVITSSSNEHFEAWKKIAEELEFSLEDSVEESIKGISRAKSLEIILKYGGLDSKFSDKQKAQLIEWKNDLYLSMIKTFSKKNLLEGVEDLLVSLKNNGKKIALASASKNAPLLLRQLEIESYFDVVVDPASLENGKPAPDIFLAAASLLGVEPKACVGVEDAISGVQAIKSAGMFAIGIGQVSVLRQADVVYDSCACIEMNLIEKMIKA